MSNTFGILAPRYTLGEEELSVESFANRKAVLEQYNMPDKQPLWGWGFYRRTRRTRAELASASAADSLASAGVPSSAIDALLVCCGDGLNYYQQNRFVGEFSAQLGLRCEFVTWVGGAGCASLFSAAKIAQAFVLGNTFRQVLVVSVDKVDDDNARFQRYGIFSDSACSFIVRSAGPVDFHVAGLGVSSSPVALRSSNHDIAEKYQLIYSVFERLSADVSFPFEGSAFLGSNVFLPIQELEFSVMPVNGLIAYRNNTARYGHCSSADPFINLIDFYADENHHAIRTAVLASTAHGHFGVMLLERHS